MADIDIRIAGPDDIQVKEQKPWWHRAWNSYANWTKGIEDHIYNTAYNDPAAQQAAMRKVRDYMPKDMAMLDKVHSTVTDAMNGNRVNYYDVEDIRPILDKGQALEEIYKIPATQWTPEQRAQVVAAQVAKHWQGHKRDADGNISQDRTAETTKKQIDNLNNIKLTQPVWGLKSFLSKEQWDKKVSDEMKSSSGKPNPGMENTKKNISQGIKESIKAYDMTSDPRGWFKLWAEQNGHKGLADFASNPVVFWGGLAAGAIGIPLLISMFLNGRGNQGGTTHNHYYGNQQGSTPTTNSYWRA